MELPNRVGKSESGRLGTRISFEGGGGSVLKDVQVYLPASAHAIETAIKYLHGDHLKHLDKELNTFLLTRIAGLLRLQAFPASADKRHKRDRDPPIARHSRRGDEYAS